MFLKSAKYPGIEYEQGKRFFFPRKKLELPSIFDVDEELTSNDAAMALIASTLDEVDTLLATTKEFLKQTLSSKDASHYGTVAYFMEYHRDQLDPDTLAELFPSCDPGAMSFTQW